MAGQLLSWGPFRKELLRWARKSDIITDVGDSATDTTRSELNSTKYSSSSQRTSTPKQDFEFLKVRYFQIIFILSILIYVKSYESSSHRPFYQQSEFISEAPSNYSYFPSTEPVSPTITSPQQKFKHDFQSFSDPAGSSTQYSNGFHLSR